MANPADTPSYTPSLAALINETPPMPLGVGGPDRVAESRLLSLAADVESELAAAACQLVDPASLDCCLAALWLRGGFLDEAHQIVQDVPTASGSYWHGVMHRREGDYGNAAYWFRRAGDHPAGSVIASAAAQSPETVELALGGRWDAVGFAERVSGVSRRSGPEAEALIALQEAEWRALMSFCWRRAVDG